MAYLGRNPAIGTQRVLDSLESQFNGSLTTFNLRYNSNTIYPTLASSLIVSLGGVLQEPGTAYDVASDQITFASAPAAGTDCWILLYSEFGAQLAATPFLTVANNLTVGGQLHGPANFIIDPAAIGNNTGTVEIKGNLTVQGTTTTINSTTVDLDMLSLGDNEKIFLGDGGTGDNNASVKDFEIYSNGSNLYIDSPFISTDTAPDPDVVTSPNIYFRTSKTTTLDRDALTILNDGKVGIGTSNPGADLEISGTNGISSTLFINAPAHSSTDISEAALKFGYSHSGSPKAVAEIKLVEGSTNSFGGDLTFGVPNNNQSGGSSTSEALRIDSSGRLLLGTGGSTSITCTALFQGRSDGATNSANLRLAKGSSTPGTTNSLGIISFADSGSQPAAQIQVSRDSGTWISGSRTPGALLFMTAPDSVNAATERLRITSDGHIGIGNNITKTWSLGKALHIGVAENALWGEADYAVHLMQNAYYNSGYKYTHTDEATLYSQEDGKHSFKVAASGSADSAITWAEALRITSTGKIGIGHQQEGQITKELTIRPANDGGIRFVRPGATGASVMSHLELTTTTAGSVFPSGEAYTVKYHTVNNDQIFATRSGGGTGGNISFQTGVGSGNEVERLRIDPDGHVTPGGDDTQDLGSTSKRWRNIYTGDLQLSNEGSSNEVDGTWGNYTIQEGEEELFIINRRSGKKFKFVLEEVK